MATSSTFAGCNGATQNTIKHVALTWIIREGQYLLLKRSAQVRSYQGHWACLSSPFSESPESVGGFSGPTSTTSTDDTPEKCALRDILESLGLASEDVSLIRSGRPFRLEHIKEYKCVWIVHPLLYSFTTADAESKIKLNWTFSEYVFKDQIDVSPLMPNTFRSWERINHTPFVESLLSPLINNKTDGATTITKLALKAFKAFVSQAHRDRTTQQAISADELVEKSKNFAWHLLNVRDSMIHVGNLIARLVTVVFKNKTYSRLSPSFTRVSNLQDAVSGAVESLIKMLDAAAARITLNFRESLQKDSTVLIHSFSGTVINAISSSQRRLKVYVTEARTGGEGRLAALQLSLASPESVSRVTLIPDSGVGAVMSSVDACVLGADSICANGSFVNKTGSHLITLAANAHKVPVYVLCDSSKIRSNSKVPQEDASISPFFADEFFNPERDSVLAGKIATGRLKFFNPMFEITPKYDNVKFISEVGFLSGDEITQLSKKILDNWSYLVEPN